MGNHSKAKENNRRLRKSALGNYFKRNRIKTTSSNVSLNREEKNYEKSIKSRQMKMLKTALTFMTLIIFVVFIWNTFISKGIGKVIDDTVESRKKITEEAIAENKQDPYLYWIDMGNNNIEKGDFETAKNDFIMALKTNKTGKRANFGLTKCLLYECKTHHQNCQLSQAYYNSLQESGNLTKEELLALDKFL